MLLYFSARNFRCFADEVELDLTTSALRTVLPRPGQSWRDVTGRVAAIYGANASGKTTVLRALHALSAAIRRPGSRGIFDPSLVAPGEPAGVTSFRAGFVGPDGIRYHYEVDAADWGIAREELVSYPKGSPRRVFLRSQDGADGMPEVVPGSSLTGPTAEVARITRSGMLLLATGRRYGHPGLVAAANALMEDVGLLSLSFRDRQDSQLLRRVVMEMVGSQHQVDMVDALLRAADLGICGIELRTEEVPPEVHAAIGRLVRALNEGDEITDDEIPRLHDVVVFRHRSRSGGEFELPVAAESAGTITWLTTAWHALTALSKGAILLVDELDASLHPALARYLVELFNSEQLNQRGAQLIFTTHDVSLLGNSPTRLLEPAAVWFLEKGEDGAAELFSLADFENRPGNNSEKRYLAGQFGAIPDIDEGLLLRFLSEGASSAAEERDEHE